MESVDRHKILEKLFGTFTGHEHVLTQILVGGKKMEKRRKLIFTNPFPAILEELSTMLTIGGNFDIMFGFCDATTFYLEH